MARSHFSSGGSSRSHSSSRSSFSSARSHSYSRTSSPSRSHISSYSRNTSHRTTHTTSHRHTSIHLHSDGSTGSIRANIKLGFGFVVFLLILVGLAISISTIGSISIAKDELTEIENSYNYYQNMISYAEANPEYKATGVITYIGPDSYSDKYYIEYRIFFVVRQY